MFVPPPVPVFSWTGFYIGGQVGYAFGSDRTTLTPVGLPAAAVGFGLGQPRPNGLIGGAHVGYNFSTQSLGLGGLGGGLFGGGLVIGLEGDINGTDYRGAAAFPGLFPYTQTTRTQIEGSGRGRVGIAVDRALFYVTGGAAFAQFQSNFNPGAVFGGGGFQQFTHSKVGYTVGGGIEYAVTTNWSLRAEYRYSDFGSFSSPVVFPGPIAVVARERVTQQRVQLGFSYKFADPIAPVVARY